MRRRAVHGLVAAIAFVILFPLGAIFLRIIPGRWSVRIHYFVQIIAWLVYIAGFALGVILLRSLPSGISGILVGDIWIVFEAPCWMACWVTEIKLVGRDQTDTWC
jgi:hypothetical protein